MILELTDKDIEFLINSIWAYEGEGFYNEGAYTEEKYEEVYEYAFRFLKRLGEKDI